MRGAISDDRPYRDKADAARDALASLDLSKADQATQYYVRRKLQLSRLAGVDRSEAERKRLKHLREDLAAAQSVFGRNINDDQRTILAKPAELDGLPRDYIDAHKPDADGMVHITTDLPDFSPVMKFASSEDLRRRLYEASVNRGYPKNHDELLKMMRLRYEIASLLGYTSWADYNAASKMTLNARTILDFIREMDTAGRPMAERELALLLKEKRKTTPDAKDIGEEEAGFLWERLSRSTLGLDSAALRPYLPFEAVKRGLLETASKFFQVTFKLETGAPAWDPAVETWDVYENGSMIGRFFLDLHPRPGKSIDPEALTMVVGKVGTQLPECALIASFPTPSATNPGLMEFDEVSQLFHEFGHVMHRILSGSRLRWAGASNSTLERDFIEMPSQLFEQLPSLPSVLIAFARHHQTNEPISADLVLRMNRASTVGRGLSMAALNLYGAIFLRALQPEPR